MRILIAAPPKTGNSWLRCLFSSAYDLKWLRDGPSGSGVDALREWVEAGRFPDRSVFHHHYDHSSELADYAVSIPAYLATILRHPYDQFVSLYFFVQAQAGNEKRAEKGRASDVMVGKPIGHPEVLAFLAEGFARDLDKGLAWLESGHSVVVRYEGLHADPVTELTCATDQIEPISPERVARAIEACEADALLKSRRGLAKRIRSATVGDWRNHLSPAHLAVFRDRHADLVRALGYEVY